jgi:RecA-family ATPase
VDWLEDSVSRAASYRQNDEGCGPPASGKTDPRSDDDVALDAKFLSAAEADHQDDEEFTLQDLLNSPTPAPALRELMARWVQAGKVITFAGRGGVHKSRLLLQLCFALLYNRDWFEQKLGTNLNTFYINGRREGGIPVARIECLSYEDDRQEVFRRVEKMRSGFATSNSDAGNRFHFRRPRVPLMTVSEKGEINLTNFGRKMLRRWEKFAEQGGHMVLWLDSFFDAVQFEGNSRNYDAVVRSVLHILDRWCELLDATILAPFHPSTAGEGRGDTGYAPAFLNVPRQVFLVTAETRQIKGGKQSEREETGRYRLSILKWTGGERKKVHYVYEDGQLVTYEPMNQQGTESSVRAAVALVLTSTYDAAALKQLARRDLTDAERQKIERKFDGRFREQADALWFGSGQHAIKLRSNDEIMEQFRHRIGNQNASVADFAAACKTAREVGRLGYIRADKSAWGKTRAPAGFCYPWPTAETEADEEPNFETDDLA